MEKFERISKKIVKVLAGPPAAASLLQRGAPTRRASEKVGSNIPLKVEKEKRKNFKELLLNSNGRPGCSQFLAVLPETAIKKSQGITDYNFTIHIFQKENNSHTGYINLS